MADTHKPAAIETAPSPSPTAQLQMMAPKLKETKAQFSVGSVEGVPFTACTSGPDIIILASNFSRVQQITTSSVISSLDCSTDVGKIAAAYDNKMVIFEPIPLVQSQQQQQQSLPQPSPPPPPPQLPQPPQADAASINSRLDYKWVQTATIESETAISVMSFNLEGNKLIAGGQTLQLWTIQATTKTNWQCVWHYRTATDISYLKFSPDGTLFCSAGDTDKLVKIWYESVTNTPSLSTVSSCNFYNDQSATTLSTPNCLSPPPAHNGAAPTFTLQSINSNGHQLDQNSNSPILFNQKYDFSFIYVAHPLPVTSLEWRRTSKYTPRGAVANILITSCKDNIARIWVQTLLPDDGLVNFNQLKSNNNEDVVDGPPRVQAQRHRQKLLRRLKKMKAFSNFKKRQALALDHSIDEMDKATTNNNAITPIISTQVNNESSNVTIVQPNGLNYNQQTPNNEINIGLPTALSAHDFHSYALCSTVIKPGLHFHLAGIIEAQNELDSLSLASDRLEGKVEEVDTCPQFVVHWINNKEIHITRSIELLLHDMLLRILKANNPATSSTNSPQSAGESCSGSENDTDELDDPNDDTITAESSKKLRHKLCRKMNKQRALAASGRKDPDSEDNNNRNSVCSDNKGPASSNGRASPTSLVDTFDKTLESLLKKWQMSTDLLFSINKSDGTLNLWQVKYLDGEDTGVFRQVQIERLSRLRYALPNYDAITMSLNVTAYSPIEPSIFIVTQHLSGILGLWKFNFDTSYPKVQSVELVTRITGLPIDPKWLRDGILSVEYSEENAVVNTSWIDDQENNNKIQSEFAFRISEMASDLNILPQYHLKQLMELLAFGKLQRVKAILNHLVNCLVQLETSHKRNIDSSKSGQWSHRSRTLSIVGRSASSFHDSFDIDNPSSTIQQQVIEEIELDYIEVTSIKPVPLYSLLEADNEKPNASTDNKSATREDLLFTSYDSIMKARSQVDVTLDEILGQSTIETINKKKELDRIETETQGKGSLTSFNPKKAKLLTRVLTHTHLPGLSNVDQMHLLAVADAVALFDASPEDYHDMNEEEDDSSGGMGMGRTSIAIDSLDDRGLRFLTAMRQHVYLTRCLPMKQRNELKAVGIGTHNIVWAFHSESQDELISLIPCVQRNKPEWSELREFGVGWWLKKLEVLKKLIEKVAQSAYQARQDPLDAALFYLAMKKKTLVCALLRRVNCDKRLLKLFEQDFNDPVNRKKALKNAYALLGLHRFEHAAAFFILAGSIWDAVEVCINNLNDIQLGIVLIRLYDTETNLPNNLKKLLSTEVLNHTDPFLRSIAFWKLGDYLPAVHTLLENCNEQQQPPAAAAGTGYHRPSITSQVMPRRSSDNSQLTDATCQSCSASNLGGNFSASVFNFYLFLKSQPLVMKYSNEAIVEKEKVLFFSTGSAYLDAGCPLLALEVLCSEDHLNTSRAQRMKFISCFHILMNELNTLPPTSANHQQLTSSSATDGEGQPDVKFGDQFYEWLKKSVEALRVLCSYNGIFVEKSVEEAGESTEGVKEEDEVEEEEEEEVRKFVIKNEPILRAMLTYCNMHSAKVNCLTTVRLELLNLLNQIE